MTTAASHRPGGRRALRLAALLALTVAAALGAPTASAMAADCGPSFATDDSASGTGYFTPHTPDGYFYDFYGGGDGNQFGDGAGTINDGAYDTNGDGDPFGSEDRNDATDGHGYFYVSGDPSAQTSGSGFIEYDNPDSQGCSFEDGNREIVYPSDTTSMPGIKLDRKDYLPDSTFHFARFLNCMTNTGTSAVSIAYQTGGNLGSDSNTRYDATSSGDTAFDASDRWASTNDGGTPPNSDPDVAIAWDSNVSNGALDRADVVSKDFPNQVLDPSDDSTTSDEQGISYHDINLAPGQMKCFAFFLAMRATPADATSAARQIGANPPELAAGLSTTERNAVQNWDFVAPASTASAPTSCSRTGDVPASVSDGRTGPRELRYSLNGNPQQALALSGDPASTTIKVPNGKYTLAYQGVDNVGNVEDPHTATVTVDNLRPGLTIRSIQHKTTYKVGQRASVRIRARDHGVSGLRSNPSRRSLRISTRHRGRHTVRRTAVDRCGNRRTTRFTYRVVAAARRVGAVRPRFTG